MMIPGLEFLLNNTSNGSGCILATDINSSDTETLICHAASTNSMYVCIIIIAYTTIIMCRRYVISTGPLSGVLHVEEFTVELLGEERLTGFIIRFF